VITQKQSLPSSRIKRLLAGRSTKRISVSCLLHEPDVLIATYRSRFAGISGFLSNAARATEIVTMALGASPANVLAASAAW
jgi:hypothetical protein